MPVLLSTAYLPKISYMAECLKSDELWIEGFETYPKQTSRNHCKIYGPNGLQTLSVPVVKVNGNVTLTKDIRIANSLPWQRLHWRSIETAYNNSPFFLFYKDEFEPFYEREFDFLLDLNSRLTEVIFKILKVRKNILHTDQFLKTQPDILDLRSSKKKEPYPLQEFHPYTQTFSPKHGFIPDLSIIDLIFNLGPESVDFLNSEK